MYISIPRFHHAVHLPGSGEIHHCVPSLLQVETHVSTKKCMRQKKRKSNSAKAAYRSFTEK